MCPSLSRRALLVAFASVAALLVAGLALAHVSALILPTHTPGARYSKVTQATIEKIICVKGWPDTLRPKQSYTDALKNAQPSQWHYADKNPSHYEEII
jgi:hypothetical protein